MELKAINDEKLSQMNSAELEDQLVQMAGQGKPADMSQDEYNSLVRKVMDACYAARAAEKEAKAKKKTKEPKEKNNF